MLAPFEDGRNIAVEILRLRPNQAVGFLEREKVPRSCERLCETAKSGLQQPIYCICIVFNLRFF